MTKQNKILMVVFAVGIAVCVFLAGLLIGKMPANPSSGNNDTKAPSTEAPLNDMNTTEDEETTPQAPTSDGLVYALVDDGSAYEVSGYTGTSGMVLIPSEYEGKLVTGIGESAFSGSSKLREITLSKNITIIGDFAFYNCSNLSNIVFTDKVQSIGDSAFEGCYGLKSLTLPYCLTSIGDRAFFTCNGVKSLTIPGSVTFIGKEAFYGCRGITKLEFDGTMAEWQAMERKSYWHEMVPASKVTCLDGSIELK